MWCDEGSLLYRVWEGETSEATGDTGSSAGCQLGGGCWCNSFFSRSVLSSLPFREPSFFLFIISSKKRQCHYWEMPFFLRVSHITSFLLLPAASHGCWPVTNWQLLGAHRGLALPISPQRQLVKQHLQSVCRGVKVQRKPAVREREACPPTWRRWALGSC